MAANDLLLHGVALEYVQYQLGQAGHVGEKQVTVPLQEADYHA